MKQLPEILKTSAVVLRARNYNEADQLLTLYTEKAGKLAAIVKGVKKPKSKLRGGVQVFSHTNVVLYLGKNLATVTQAEPINTFAPLREDLSRMSSTAYLADLLENLIPEGESDEKLFKVILMGLYLLSLEEPWLATKVMELRLLRQLGYEPILGSCANCGRKEAGINYFSPELGGFLCGQCLSDKPGLSVVKASGETCVILRQLMTMELRKINRLRISTNAKKELDEILDLHIVFCLGKKLKSKEFLNALTI
ncbi:MAG: DNA repair protein RecO [Peptococcales bacterium]